MRKPLRVCFCGMPSRPADRLTHILLRPPGVAYLERVGSQEDLFETLAVLFRHPLESIEEGGCVLEVTGEQWRFFEELLAYLREELEARRDPEGVEQRIRMFASLAGEAGRDQVLKD